MRGFGCEEWARRGADWGDGGGMCGCVEGELRVGGVGKGGEKWRGVGLCAALREEGSGVVVEAAQRCRNAAVQAEALRSQEAAQGPGAGGGCVSSAIHEGDFSGLPVSLLWDLSWSFFGSCVGLCWRLLSAVHPLIIRSVWLSIWRELCGRAQSLIHTSLYFNLREGRYVESLEISMLFALRCRP